MMILQLVLQLAAAATDSPYKEPYNLMKINKFQGDLMV